MKRASSSEETLSGSCLGRTSSPECFRVLRNAMLESMRAQRADSLSCMLKLAGPHGADALLNEALERIPPSVVPEVWRVLMAHTRARPAFMLRALYALAGVAHAVSSSRLRRLLLHVPSAWLRDAAAAHLCVFLMALGQFSGARDVARRMCGDGRRGAAARQMLALIADDRAGRLWDSPFGARLRFSVAAAPVRLSDCDVDANMARALSRVLRVCGPATEEVKCAVRALAESRQSHGNNLVLRVAYRWVCKGLCRGTLDSATWTEVAAMAAGRLGDVDECALLLQALQPNGRVSLARLPDAIANMYGRHDAAAWEAVMWIAGYDNTDVLKMRAAIRRAFMLACFAGNLKRAERIVALNGLDALRPAALFICLRDTASLLSHKKSSLCSRGSDCLATRTASMALARQSHSLASAAIELSIAPRCTASAAVARRKVRIFTSALAAGDELPSAERCPICLEEPNADSFVAFPCAPRHVYCTECFLAWFSKAPHKECVLCFTPLLDPSVRA